MAFTGRGKMFWACGCLAFILVGLFAVNFFRYEVVAGSQAPVAFRLDRLTGIIYFVGPHDEREIPRQRDTPAGPDLSRLRHAPTAASAPAPAAGSKGDIFDRLAADTQKPKGGAASIKGTDVAIKRELTALLFGGAPNSPRGLAAIKKAYPVFKDVPDLELAKAIHTKFYANMDFQEFAAIVGARP